jgi:predicted Rossmann fold flavoprotein
MADKKIQRVAVIGGGAAGMMCAATINELNPTIEVFLIEKNESLGKKVIISGGGRCNVTTGITDVDLLLTKYPRGQKFLAPAMHGFPPEAVMAWFEDHGVPLKCEKDLRVFPVSNKGKDVVGAFEKVFAQGQTKVLYQHSVQAVEKNGDQFVVNFRVGDPVTVDAVVFAVGGQAYRQTGSTGDGYTMAESLGHTITELAPSLSSLLTTEAAARDISGVSFPKATLTAYGSEKQQFTGPFIFTHFGVSGPAVFALSGLTAYEKFDTEKPLKLTIDLIPEVPQAKALTILKTFMKAQPKKFFAHTLHKFVPMSVANVIIKEIGMQAYRQNNLVTDKEVIAAVDWLKAVPLTVVGRRPGDEFVTAGGINLSEIDAKTLESKICPRLYFAGELIDVDGFTGGFNLQASWATGRAAGVSIASL